MPTLIKNLRSGQPVKEAMYAAQTFCTSEPVKAVMPKDQGMFSLTVIVTLKDGSQVIVQLKDNEIDLTRVALARGLLGSVVPSMHAAKPKSVHYAYVAEYIQGACWGNLSNLSLSEDVSIASQIGTLIADCSLGPNAKSAGIVDNYIVPRLAKILEKEPIADATIRQRLDRLMDTVGDLKALPLALCHIDINARNIILGDEIGGKSTHEGGIQRRVVGLIDWEYAAIFPLGMNAWCIRFLSVPTLSRKDRIMDSTQPMVDAFWKALTAKLPKELHRNLVTAMQVGFVIIHLFFEGATVDDVDMAEFAERYDWLTNCFESLCADR